MLCGELFLECQIKAECINGRHRIAAVVYAESNGRTAQFGSVTGVVFPGFQVLDVDVELQGLHTDSGYQGLVEVIRQLYVADTEEAAVFDVVLGIHIVDGMLRVEQGLGIACTRSVPAVHALFHEVELAPVVVVPGTEYLVTALSHHVDAELPVLIAYAEGDAVSDIRGRVAYQGTVGSGDFTVTVHILEFQVARSHGGQGILGRPGYFFVGLFRISP